MRNTFIAILALLCVQISSSQEIDLKQIVSKAENRLRGKSSISTMKITTVRPKYTREMTVKSWTQNEDYALMYIAAPARDKGTTYLKREKEIWYYIPSIERNIKMPPSMMNQSWMGTDLSNDDLVKKTSMENDFDHTLIGTENINGVECYHISLIPHDDAEVIWGKIEIWVDKKFYNVMQQKSYDEDLELVNTIVGSEVKVMDGETIPTRMDFFPADKPKQSTVMEYLEIDYNVDIPEHYFTTRFMNKVK